MEPSGLTTKMIHDSAVYESILLYLQPGETREAFMKQFGNNLDKTINFLRQRSYEGLEKPKPIPVAQARKVVKEKEPEDNIMHPKYDPVYESTPVAKPSKSNKSKTATPDKKARQQDLF